MSEDAEQFRGSTPGQAGDLSPSSVFRLRDLDHLEAIYAGRETGYFYARDGHPNAARLAAHLAEIEGGEMALIAPSGMGAIAALLLHLLRPGDRLVADAQLYGKTSTLVDRHLREFSVEVVLADLSDATAAKEAIRPGTKMVWIESLSNPMLRWSPVDRLAEWTTKVGAILAVDNTFTPPPILRPIDLGADIVMHSLTKIISGHSDVTLGCLVGKKDLIDAVKGTASTFGYHAPAFDCWLTERSLPTLELRVREACANARRLADFLKTQPGIRRVIYPGLGDHPEFEWGQKFAPLAGHMLAIELADRAAVNRLFGRLKHVPFRSSLGDVMTTVTHPVSTSHRTRPVEEREQIGITEGFVRVSVGIEPIDRITQDFEQALQR